MTVPFESLLVSGPTGDLVVTRSGDPDAGPSVVLLHPINTASVVWHPVMRLLDRPVVAVDLRGHGRSGLAGPFTVEDGYVLDVLAVVEELGLDAVHLAGGSLGGSIALAVAALHPHLVHTVTTLGSTLGTGVPDAAVEEMVDTLNAAGSRRYFAELVPQIVGPGHLDAPGLAQTALAAGTRPESTVAAILRAAFTADVRHLVASVVAPVLAVGGSADPTCPPAMTVEIATRTGGSHVILEGAGHLPMLEEPARVANLIDAHATQQQL